MNNFTGTARTKVLKCNLKIKNVLFFPAKRKPWSYSLIFSPLVLLAQCPYSTVRPTRSESIVGQRYEKVIKPRTVQTTLATASDDNPTAAARTSF